MHYYYINNDEQSDEKYEVHKSGCTKIPERHNWIILGSYSNCIDPVAAAKQIYPQAKACTKCCPESK